MMRSSLIVVCMMLLFSAGCQIFDVDWPRGVTTCKVKGMVTLDGQAISDVKLVFVPQRVGKKGDLNRIASGTSNGRGEFTLSIDAKKAKQIRHGRYRVIVSKIVDGEELFHKSYNAESMLMVEIDSQEAIQRPDLDLISTGTY